MRYGIGGVIALAALGLWGCDVLLDDQDDANREVLFQASTLDALLVGAYDGMISFADLREHGDFGLGTVDALDGEMIMLDGVPYQVRTDGVAARIDDAATSPFAVLTFFDADSTVAWSPGAEPVDCAEFQAAVDALLPDLETPYAVKVEGTFARLKTRSVDRQEPPYPPLADVVAAQTEFDFTDVEGTMVGFRLPDYMAGFNVTGYHFHFLTADRASGGHVLACEPSNVTIVFDDADVWQIVLPDEAGALAPQHIPEIPHP